ncbi:hypothetical protein Mapa_014690 [Marchantia paleacea]|nr:hypothetical protein Mapa_014690 [Marchantia paleacea]
MVGKRRDVRFSRTPPNHKRSKFNKPDGTRPAPRHSESAQRSSNDKFSRHPKKIRGSRFKEGAKISEKVVKKEEVKEEVEEEVLNFLDDETTAYNALLKSLHAKGGSFADAYAQRQREEHGASSSGEDDLGEPEEEDETAVDGSEDDGASTELPHEELEDEEDDDDEWIEEHGKDNEDGSDDKTDEKADTVGQIEDQSEHESEDETDARVASGGQAGTCPDPFKMHLERGLVDDEIAKLSKGGEKFSTKFPAAGIEGGSWVSTAPSAPPQEKLLTSCSVKKRLEASWRESHKELTWGDFETEQQCQFFSLCNSYQDILHTRRLVNKGDGAVNHEDVTTMDAYILHILNHLTKSRDMIQKNNEKLHHASSGGFSLQSVVDPPRDQGFTRPKVLVLLPFRSSALKFVDRLLNMVPAIQKANVEHKDRFFDDFGALDEEDAEALGVPNKKDPKAGKPADFRALFSGNNDDHFRIGLKFTRKGIKLYSEFYSSDVIIASPVGLVTRIGEAESEKTKEIDFLSSIEIAVVDFVDIILMQNWAHVATVFEHLNKIPAQQHGTDFMRIREWFLNGHGRHYRQSIILSAFSDAGVNALFHRTCVNHAGKVKVRCQYEGVLSRIVLQVRQVYEKMDCTSIANVDDLRFEFFTTQVFPRIKNSIQGGTLLFVPSYFDFVRLRNFLKSQSASFALLGEYTKQSDISRARSWFYHGERKILLYTERAHFFHRYKIRGIKDIIFYSLPEHANYYVELLNLLEGNEAPSCTVIFSRFDNLQLERVIGTSRSKKMLSSPSRLFMFM